MSLFDIGVVASILHAVFLILGYLGYSNAFASIRSIADPLARAIFFFVLHVTPTALLCGTISCWMAVIHQSQRLAIFFLVFPVGVPLLALLLFMIANLEERGMSNKEIFSGSDSSYYRTRVSHVDFANEMIARMEDYRNQNPEFTTEKSPYIDRRLRE